MTKSTSERERAEKGAEAPTFAREGEEKTATKGVEEEIRIDEEQDDEIEKSEKSMKCGEERYKQKRGPKQTRPRYTHPKRRKKEEIGLHDELLKGKNEEEVVISHTVHTASTERPYEGKETERERETDLPPRVAAPFRFRFEIHPHLSLPIRLQPLLNPSSHLLLLHRFRDEPFPRSNIDRFPQGFDEDVVCFWVDLRRFEEV